MLGLPKTPHLKPVSNDASLRRYFRIAGIEERILAVDAPPPESVPRFAKVRAIFAAAGLCVPEIHAAEPCKGFMLVQDFGDRLYETACADADRTALYQAAWQAIIRLQLRCASTGLPRFDEKFMRRELGLFPLWYCDRLRGRPLDEPERAQYARACDALLGAALTQAALPMHRDFHSRNLFARNGGPGIIDFQDAAVGPATYDIASLLRDIYVRLDKREELLLLAGHWTASRAAGLPVSDDYPEHLRQYRLMSLQRHMKILGLFARAAIERGRTELLNRLPRCAAMVCAEAVRHDATRPLALMVNKRS